MTEKKVNEILNSVGRKTCVSSYALSVGACKTMSFKDLV